jgi:hypothetical protein
MERSTEAELELPFQEIADEFKISLDELEAAMMTGAIKVDQETIPPKKEGDWPSSVQLTLTMGGKVISMPVPIVYPETED